MSHTPGPPFLTRFLAQSRNPLLLVLSLSSWVVLFLSPLLGQSLLVHDPIGFFGWDGGINRAWRNGVTPLPDPHGPTTSGLVLLWLLGLVTLYGGAVVNGRRSAADVGPHRAIGLLAAATGPAMVVFALLCLALDAVGMWWGTFIIETALMHLGTRYDTGRPLALATIGVATWIVVTITLHRITRPARSDDWAATLTASLLTTVVSYVLWFGVPSSSWGSRRFDASHTAEILLGHAFLWSYATSVSLLLFMPPHVRRLARSKRDGICAACGYDLRGTRPGASCPECGAPTAVR